MSLNQKMKDYFDKNKIETIFSNEQQFKLKLNLTDSTYQYLINVKNLEKFASSLAVGLASAAAVYATWLASLGFIAKAGLLLGLASNPIGWMVLSGAGGAILMYGGKTLIDKFDKEAHDKTPKFLNTPLDFLGQQLMNIILPIAVKLSMQNNTIDSKLEEEIIKEFKSWGYDESYLKGDLKAIKFMIDDLKIEKTKEKLQAICKEVEGLKYEHLKEIITESLYNTYEKKGDKSDFRNANILINKV